MNNSHKGVEFVQLMNGNSWTLEALCKDISAKYRIKNYNADVIVVWIDLEKQACGSQNVATAITQALVDAGADPLRVCVCVPDRMSENAILADEELIRSYFEDPLYAYQSEGGNGKQVLKSMFASKGINYKETKHGVDLLRKMRLERSAASSPSVSTFHSKVTALTQCWWF